jgi:hypothetical protein
MAPEKVKPPLKPKGLTPEEKALSDQLARAYYTGLVASIRSLDDGISPAESIGRAAISENIQLLRDCKRADRVDLVSELQASTLLYEQMLSDLPSRSFIDNATTFVLKVRKQQNQMVIEP